jgi:hypothetical protein
MFACNSEKDFNVRAHASVLLQLLLLIPRVPSPPPGKKFSSPKSHALYQKSEG